MAATLATAGSSQTNRFTLPRRLKPRCKQRRLGDNSNSGAPVSLEAAHHLYRNTDRGNHLRKLQGFPPPDSATQGAVWNHDHVAGLHSGLEGSAIKQRLGSTGDGSIGANDEDILFVTCRCGTARLVQVPVRALARAERDRGLVIDGAFDHDKIRALGNVDRIASTQLHIPGSVNP